MHYFQEIVLNFDQFVLLLNQVKICIWEEFIWQFFYN